MALSEAVAVFFFFQAEDGIRDYKVTGVQTCALPICRAFCTPALAEPERLPAVPLMSPEAPLPKLYINVRKASHSAPSPGVRWREALSEIARSFETCRSPRSVIAEERPTSRMALSWASSATFTRGITGAPTAPRSCSRGRSAAAAKDKLE